MLASWEEWNHESEYGRTVTVSPPFFPHAGKRVANMGFREQWNRERSYASSSAGLRSGRSSHRITASGTANE